MSNNTNETYKYSKRFLDHNGLSAFWDIICDKFATKSEALKNVSISTAELVNYKDNDTNTFGPYIKLVLNNTAIDNKVTTQEPKYINVADLVDVYSAGNGLYISEIDSPIFDQNGNPQDIDNSCTTATISLNTAKAGTDDDKIGGIKVYNVSSNPSNGIDATTTDTYDITFNNDPSSAENNSNRFLGVELDTYGRAYVYNPIESVTVDSTDATSESLTFNDTFTAVTNISTDVDLNNGAITVTKELTTFTLPGVTITNNTDPTPITKTIQTNVDENVDDTNKTFEFTTLTGLSIDETNGIITSTTTTHKLSVDVNSITNVSGLLSEPTAQYQ